jgi:hypothetical protein
MGFEPTIPAFEQANAAHALDRAIIMIARLKISDGIEQ